MRDIGRIFFGCTIIVLALCVATLFSQSGNNTTPLNVSGINGNAVRNVAGSDDPCMTNVIKSRKVIADLAASTKLIAGVAGQSVYPCAIYITATGTTPTVKFQSGTGAVCATNLQSLTGTMAADKFPSAGYGGMLLQSTNPGDDFCVAITGSSPVVSGWMDYVQQ